MGHKKSSSKKITKRLERKSFRSAEKRALRGDAPRSLRMMQYATPASMRVNKLPLDGG